ncbi:MULTISPECIES: class I SAM-dependent methyltransferase [unclassified Bradyrhizobium]|uniref:class I SAM-dependent methyltransferase n=1 Tax=unclassified Bradyrhizobium TaxID=2631580 RepID=UPI0028E2CC1A|nr:MULTISPECIES: class I SAM-dependent methyltransferase [unclassified Bradyrhizobium]
MEQRFTFNQVADVYQASRPGYPDALIDDVIAYAAIGPDDSMLEVGCGTGQATISFAKKGCAILATDPGAEMLRGAREYLREFGNVDYLQTTFEALPDTYTGCFRLIVAAQCWHWVAPDVRFTKAAKVLSPNGALAVFGHVPVRLPERLRDVFRHVYLEWVGRWLPPPEVWYFPDGPFKSWFDESGLFQPVAHRSYPWVWRHTTASYLAFLQTRSDHRMLAAEQREHLLADLAQAIDAEGGRLDIDYETHLYMSRLV